MYIVLSTCDSGEVSQKTTVREDKSQHVLVGLMSCTLCRGVCVRACLCVWGFVAKIETKGRLWILTFVMQFTFVLGLKFNFSRWFISISSPL